MSDAVLYAYLDPGAQKADEVYAWYEAEHVPGRLAVPGFRTARRLRRRDVPTAAVMIYELDDLDTWFAREHGPMLLGAAGWDGALQRASWRRYPDGHRHSRRGSSGGLTAPPARMAGPDRSRIGTAARGEITTIAHGAHLFWSRTSISAIMIYSFGNLPLRWSC